MWAKVVQTHRTESVEKGEQRVASTEQTDTDVQMEVEYEVAKDVSPVTQPQDDTSRSNPQWHVPMEEESNRRLARS